VALSCNDPGASIIAPPGDSQHIDIVPAKTKRTYAGVGDDRFGHLAALLHRHDVDEMQGVARCLLAPRWPPTLPPGR